MLQTINQALHQVTKPLENISDTPRLDAETLLSYALDVNKTYLYTWSTQILTNEQYQQFQILLNRRLTGEPVAYITGVKEFWSLPFKVTPATLIPRPETELIVEFCLTQFDAQKPLKLLDLGTGSGAIAIAIASERPHWQITATDISQEALNIARANANKLKTNHIQFITSNWFSNMSHHQFDIIISNPPYISPEDDHLSHASLAYEPVTALVSENNGMADLLHIIKHAPQYLTANGYLILEHGYNQSNEVIHSMQAHHYDDIKKLHDLSSISRVATGRIK